MPGSGMKETVIESPLIGSGSQEEADARVQILLDLGKSRGYLTYEELNEKLPDEVVSPDKLDSLLMMIDEMGIKLIDEADVGEYVKAPRVRAKKPQPATDGSGDGKAGKSGKDRDRNGKDRAAADGEATTDGEAEDDG